MTPAITFLQEFNKRTKSKGSLIVDANGLTLYSEFPNIDNVKVDKLAAMAAVSDSISSNVIKDLTENSIEISILVNEKHYILIKPIEDKYIFLSQYDRNENLAGVYDDVNNNFKIITNNLK